MYLSIDEAHILLVLPSTADFQSVSFGLIWKRIINLILALLTNLTLATLLVIIVFWLPQLNAYSEKTSPYECGFDPIGLAHKILSSGHYISSIWPGNCTPSTTTLSLTTNQPKHNAHHSPLPDPSIGCKPSLWMNPKRTRMDQIWYLV